MIYTDKIIGCFVSFVYVQLIVLQKKSVKMQIGGLLHKKKQKTFDEL